MKIAVNTRLLLKGHLEGIGWFTYETLQRMTKQHPEHQFFFLFDRPYDPAFIFSDNVTPVIISPPARHPFLFYIWFEFSVPRILSKLKADLFLSPDGYLSLSTKVKSVAVIHDLNFEHYPKGLPWLITKYYKYFFPQFARKAARIATVSEFSKADIVSLYGISPGKIDVVYNGVADVYKPLDESRKQEIRSKYSAGCEYFLFVGSLHPRKNIANLLKSFDEFKKSAPGNTKLLMAGHKKWWTKEIRETFEGMSFKEDVTFTGHLGNEELALITGSALALTYTSCFEGFGIPIVEAFKCRVPVITSDVTSMPEVSGGAALLTDPFSVESIKRAMLKVYSDPELRKKLCDAGEIRSKEFSWDKTAELLYQCISRA